MSKDAFVHKVLAEMGLEKHNEERKPQIRELEDLLDQYKEEIGRINDPLTLEKYLGNLNVRCGQNSKSSTGNS